MEEKIKWAIIGTGYIANRFADGMCVVKDADLAAVVSRSEESGRKFAQKYGCQRVYTDLKIMLDTEKIDIVYLAIPNSCHFRYIMEILEREIPVLSEKPMVDNEMQLEQVLNKAKEKNVFLMEGMWTRCFPAVIQARKWIKEGRIGMPLTVRAGFDIKPDVNDWQPWKAGIKYAAGALRDVGIYSLGIAYMVFPEGPEMVYSNMKSNGEVDECFQMLLSYPGGRSALLSGAFNQIGNPEVEIVGEEGSILIGPEFWHPTTATLVLNNGKKECFSEDYPETGFQYEIQEVMKCLSDGKKECPHFTWKESVAIGRLIEKTRKEWGIFYESDPDRN